MTGRVDPAADAAFPADVAPEVFWGGLEGRRGVSWGVNLDDLAKAHSGLVIAAPGMMGQVYLATPYSKVAAPRGVFDLIAARRVAESALLRMRQLAERGVCAVSPIVLSHAMVEDKKAYRGTEAAGQWALDAQFWTRWCAPLLAASSAVYVPDIPGWRDSAGIRHEVTVALSRAVPVYIAGWP